jgi:2-dehydropantoate 2-reductase
MSRRASASFPNVVIVGCGAIGGVLGAHLLQAGYSFSICTTNATVRAVWTTTGPSLDGQLIPGALAKVRVLDDLSAAPTAFDLAFVAVPPQHIDSVARDLGAVLAPQGKVVCLSNGLCEPHLADVLGEERVMGAVVTWGARMPSPGQYVKTSKGGFVTGVLKGPWDNTAQAACTWLSCVGPVTRTDNLKGARMSKLAINCAVSGLGTVGGTVLGKILAQKAVRDVAIQILTEAVLVSQAQGVHLPRLVGVNWRYFTALQPSRSTHLLQHALLLAVGFRYRKLRSSILASIERGRSPAIDHINGEICAMGRRSGVRTPYNDAIVDAVWQIARGEIQAGPSALLLIQSRARKATLSTPSPEK